MTKALAFYSVLEQVMESIIVNNIQIGLSITDDSKVKLNQSFTVYVCFVVSSRQLMP